MDKIEKTISFVKEKLDGAEAGHDWFHVERVWKLAKKMASEEKHADTLVVELAALLHDIADPKFHDGDEDLAIKISHDFLEELNISSLQKEHILLIIKKMSFKNRQEVNPSEQSIEFQMVQDADRLDAIGAIGIARAFHFGGFKNNLMYHPDIEPNIGMTKSEYKKSNGTTINHFYEKLLLLKTLMNTTAGRRMAEERHDYMLNFIRQFQKEWNGE